MPPIAQIGVGPDGAAGSVSHLDCTIDPNTVKQRAAGGCTYTPWP